jgi:hypothetical protein
LGVSARFFCAVRVAFRGSTCRTRRLARHPCGPGQARWAVK